jgi:hypothetical protein
MRKMILLLLLQVLVLGCGKNTRNAEGREMAEALHLLNSKNYEAAIPKLEKICQRQGDVDCKIKLMHAYAGAGGFEALRVMRMAKVLEKNLVEAKKIKTSDLLLTTKMALDPMPILTPHKKHRINQAIAIYDVVEPYFETAGQYNNFKWGLLHAFRLGTTMKSFYIDVAEAIEGKNKIDAIRPLRKKIGKNFESIFQDASWTYKLLKHSYPKFQKIMLKFDKLLIPISPHSQNIYHDIIRHLEGFVTLMIDDLAEENPELSEELRKINIQDLLGGANEAFNESLRDGKLDPMRDYFNETRKEWKLIYDAFIIYNKKHKVFKLPRIEIPEIKVPEMPLPVLE